MWTFAIKIFRRIAIMTQNLIPLFWKPILPQPFIECGSSIFFPFNMTIIIHMIYHKKVDIFFSATIAFRRFTSISCENFLTQFDTLLSRAFRNYIGMFFAPITRIFQKAFLTIRTCFPIFTRIEALYWQRSFTLRTLFHATDSSTKRTPLPVDTMPTA